MLVLLTQSAAPTSAQKCRECLATALHDNPSLQVDSWKGKAASSRTWMQPDVKPGSGSGLGLDSITAYEELIDSMPFIIKGSVAAWKTWQKQEESESSAFPSRPKIVVCAQARSSTTYGQ
ncbi:hypothetical protein MPTK1_4g07700 [Marchantia polymorpha subsp. ruderalis]|uniref:Uncharacterized protein n=2 Tax=Marchantia polymorpha TaxID=3197 RepID=A0AAF6B7I6_MARPO|nr:hypothetical protein MARPO_0115s0010 [Marchantia polymorpha]BBN07970.1 hypothetical protein Mp_4g07700 [Marchantia polymorpha subsp. ruderalis]|eukprot:PTQ31082.1 hypothetical protein MARPO_0115s0010 [Marchantia polymorpha]